jgi:hypothetical protein
MAALAPVVEDAERERKCRQCRCDDASKGWEDATLCEHHALGLEEHGEWVKRSAVNESIDELEQQVAALTAERDRLREALDRAGLQ